MSYDQAGVGALVYENGLAGTLSATRDLVFAVDDLAVPIPPKLLAKQFWDQAKHVRDRTKPLVVQNRLLAYEAETGKRESAGAGDPKFPDHLRDPPTVT